MNSFIRRDVIFFAISGVIGYVVDTSFTLLFDIWIDNLLISRVPGFLVAATATWVFNRLVTFQDRKSNKPLIKEYVNYLSLMVGGGVVNYTIYLIAMQLLSTVPYGVFICIGLGALAGMAVNYTSSRKVIFNSLKDDAK